MHEGQYHVIRSRETYEDLVRGTRTCRSSFRKSGFILFLDGASHVYRVFSGHCDAVQKRQSSMSVRSVTSHRMANQQRHHGIVPLRDDQRIGHTNAC